MNKPTKLPKVANLLRRKAAARAAAAAEISPADAGIAAARYDRQAAIDATEQKYSAESLAVCRLADVACLLNNLEDKCAYWQERATTSCAQRSPSCAAASTLPCCCRSRWEVSVEELAESRRGTDDHIASCNSECLNEDEVDDGR